MTATAPGSSAERDPIELMAESFLERFRRGERPSIHDYAAQHPELADEIRELLPALVEAVERHALPLETAALFDELRIAAATEERSRLAAEAAELLARQADQARQDRDAAAALAAGRLLAVQEDVDDLRRQRDEARESLRRLTDQIGEALHAVSVAVDEPNIAREYPLRPVAS